MKKTAITLAIVMLAVLCTPAVHADADKPAAHGKTVKAKLASFDSPTLKSDPTKMKTVAKALAETKGIYSAKLDKESQLLHIVFDPKKATADTIEKALAGKLGDLKQKDVKDTTFTPKDCGKCPSASKCPSKNKK